MSENENKNRLRLACAQHVKEARLKLNLSQIEFAKLVGMDRSYYARVEAGRTNTSLNTLDKIRGLLFITVPRFPSLVGEVGNRISLAREGRFSQEALSEAAGLGLFYVGRVERGVTNPGLDQIEAIGTALGISSLDLLAI
jgi:transcriptional regulator with XRE-family HTH domain